MRLEWIDDILAVLDCGSLAQAAERRMVTQSAFTRRVRVIEQSIGATLFDRRRKPISLMAGVQAQEPELREMSTRLHKLRQSLATTNESATKPLVFVCQHALTTTISPQVVRAAAPVTSVRVRSGNQDECLMQLLSKQVDLAIMYALPDSAPPGSGGAFEVATLGTDTLIPVCTPQQRPDLARTNLPVIAYPPDVFLGDVFARRIAPHLPPALTVQPVAETALTLAMLELALSGIATAWLPASLAATHLASGALLRVDDILPAQSLQINMVRLHGAHSDQNDDIWHRLTHSLRVQPADARSGA